MKSIGLVAGGLLAVLPALPGYGGEAFDYHEVRGRAGEAGTEARTEGEWLPMRGTSRVQGMGHYGGAWSRGAHVLWEGEEGEKFETAVAVPQAGSYEFAMRFTKAPDYGKFSVLLNGVELGAEIDLYSPRVELAGVIGLGEVELEKGEQVLELVLTGANAAANKFRGKRYLMGLDYVELVDLEEPVEVVELEVRPVAVVSNATLEKALPVLREHCFKCHGGEGKVKGDVDLSGLLTKEDFLEEIETTQLVADVLAYGEMPPEDEEGLEAEELGVLRGVFDSYLDEYLESERKLPAVVMRRMNRYEYNNAVRDLLELKGDVYPLPEKVIRGGGYFDPGSGVLPDVVRASNRALGKNQIEQHILSGVVPFAIDLQAEHGFNNRGEELSVSPILLESFLKLGSSIVESPEFDGYTGLGGTLFGEPEGLDLEAQVVVAEERLEGFLARAFRAEIGEETLGRYVAFFRRELAGGAGFRDSMKRVVAGVLASPRFLYLNEWKRGVEEPERLGGYELANRLAFFLWSSIPDAELLEVAASGELSDPEVYRLQVTRMLEDRRSKALAENFARQWLRLDQLITAVPDFERFGIYYSRIGCEQWKFGLQTMIEPLLLFESVMVEDRSVMLLVDSNYSYRSDEMRSWYADEVPFGNRANRNRFNTNAQDFRRTALGTRREGGVMTTAAVLTMTSAPLRTSPITRGAWVATVMFNRPPPPPPDVVPEIEEDDAAIEAAGMTLRQRLVAHQENPSCVSCHAKIDPMGFALENYDAIGRWRERYASGLEIDASGKLYGMAEFDDVVGMKDAMLENPSWFMRAFTEHLLAYALGRELELVDRPEVDKIVRDVMADRGQFSTVVHGIANSYPFLHKTNQKPDER
ncbi:MAG: DUF1588 domain-containing protein [Verrucomicrobiales bacterium]|nr:DUF1588 domain-containing protein [Verrucomicrobiales bacterium]